MKNKNKVHDLTGKKFGKLEVIGIADTKTRRTYWVCKCDCGNYKNVRSDSLLCGAIKSCGCLKREQNKINLNKSEAKQTFFKRGFKSSGDRLYSIWQGVKFRCYNKHDARYHRYGGRGIKLCDEWQNDFMNFYNWAINNGYSEKLTIDRIDNDKDYMPENCRWVDIKTQCNNRCTNIKITIGNATKTLTEWCNIFELDYKKISARYKRNGFISIDELFNR